MSSAANPPAKKKRKTNEKKFQLHTAPKVDANVTHHRHVQYSSSNGNISTFVSRFQTSKRVMNDDTTGVMQDLQGVMQDLHGFSEEPNHDTTNHEHPLENEGVDEAYLAHLAATADEEGIRCLRPKGVCTMPFIRSIPDT